MEQIHDLASRNKDFVEPFRWTRNLMAKRLFCLVLALMCLGLPVRAGFVPHASLNQIADKSDVLVAGEVLEVQPVKAVPNSSITAVNTKATVRVLRAYPAEAITSPTIEVEYRTFGPQWQKDAQGRLFTTDMSFSASPSLRVGQRVVLPLNKPAVAGKAWPFSIAAGLDLLVPVALRAPGFEATTSRLDFLENELAGALAQGDARELRPAIDYLFNVELYSYGAAGKALPDAIYRRAAARIGEDEGRWLDIAVAALQNISRTTPRSSIAQMRVGTKGQRPNKYWPLLTQALGHLHAPSSTRFDQEKLIAALIAAKADVMLAENYSTNPQVLRYFGNGLAQGQPESLRRIMALLDNPARTVSWHPLILAALTGARRALAEKRPFAKTPFYEAVTLIRKYGDAGDWQFYRSELRRAQHSDFKRFAALYGPVRAKRPAPGTFARFRRPALRSPDKVASART
jgi:hypothetical protein